MSGHRQLRWDQVLRYAAQATFFRFPLRIEIQIALEIEKIGYLKSTSN